MGNNPSTIGGEFGEVQSYNCSGDSYITKVSGKEYDYLRGLKIECSNGTSTDVYGFNGNGADFEIQSDYGFTGYDGAGNGYMQNDPNVSNSKVVRLSLYTGDKKQTIKSNMSAPDQDGLKCNPGEYLSNVHVWKNQYTNGISGVRFECKKTDAPSARKIKDDLAAAEAASALAREQAAKAEEQARLEAELAEAKRIEAEKVAAAKAEEERIAREAAEAEAEEKARLEREEAERKAAEAEKQRQEAQQIREEAANVSANIAAEDVKVVSKIAEDAHTQADLLDEIAAENPENTESVKAEAEELRTLANEIEGKKIEKQKTADEAATHAANIKDSNGSSWFIPIMLILVLVIVIALFMMLFRPKSRPQLVPALPPQSL